MSIEPIYIFREVEVIKTETRVAGKAYQITVSERERALILYLLGAVYYGGATRLCDLLAEGRWVDELSHVRMRSPGISLPHRTREYLESLSHELP